MERYTLIDNDQPSIIHGISYFWSCLVFQVGLQILEEETMMTKEPRDWATIDSSIAIGDKAFISCRRTKFSFLDFPGDRACNADGST